MIDLALQQQLHHPYWTRVLTLYRERHLLDKQSRPDYEGWQPRVAQVEGIATEELSQVHGKLIAYGMLKFQLLNRTVGMAYQLTPVGLEFLRHMAGETSSAELDTDSLTEVAEEADCEAETV